ncbi:unannotated protein [freshwater metagenome]|uniref:Unannotated protein n=1 Tax=freshwater metagenome TaxID=449393 RepID=A0A6J6A1J0_9ZZZZ
MLAGAIVAVFAVSFVGRAEAASVFSSPFASPSVFAQPAASAASVVAGERALTLSWGAVKGAAGYRVSWRGRVLKGGKPTAVWSSQWLGLKVLAASARSYKATGLVNGAEYQLRLESNTKAKKSLWVSRSTPVASPKAATPTPTATAPSAPMSVAGVAGDTWVAVSWSAPSSDGGSAVTGYKVIASGGGSPSTTECAASPCTVPGLTNGTPYTFTVKATNARGDSPASAASAAVTPFGLPAVAAEVVATAGDGAARVSFVAGFNGSQATTYTVTAVEDPTKTATGDASPIVVPGLTNGTSYTFTVKATNSRGDSPASAASAAVTPRALPPVPTSVVASPGDGVASVSFAAGAGPVSSTATSYTVTAVEDPTKTATGSTSPIVVTGLANGTSYTFTVKATNSRGDSAASAASVAVTPSVASCANGRAVCVVGDIGPGGGKVFYAPVGGFTETDAPCGSSCRYLEAARVDWNGAPGSGDPSLQWGVGDTSEGTCSNRDIPVTAGGDIGSGFANTTAIMAACSAASGINSAPAARAAFNYAPSVNGATVTGWFLPALAELNQFLTSGAGPAPSPPPGSYGWSAYWWSSTRMCVSFSCALYASAPGFQSFMSGSPQFVSNSGFLKNGSYLVRPVRAFN